MRVITAFALLAAVVSISRADDHRQLWLYNIHTKEELRVQPFGEHGLVTRSAWGPINRFFRDWRSGERRTMNPRLLRTLVQLQSHFAGRRIDLLSAYRPPEDSYDLHSYHNVGHASDLLIEGIEPREIHDYCRTLVDVGCGFYPRSGFVHVDVRSRATVWVDVSAHGEKRRYVKNPGAWLREHPNAGRFR